MKIKAFPKVVYVCIGSHTPKNDYLDANISPHGLIQVGDSPRKIGVYELKEVETIEAVVLMKRSKTP